MSLQAIKSSVIKFIKDEEGLTTVEYAVAGGLVSLAVITAFTNLGTAVGDIIESLTDTLNTANNAGGTGGTGGTTTP